MTGRSVQDAGGRHDAGMSRRRFLVRGLGGMTVLGLSGPASSWARPRATHDDLRRGIRVDVHSRVFNGQDLPLDRFLSVVVAPEHPTYAELLRAGARVAQALAWALAPSAAAESWRLEALARRRGPGLATSDDPEILRDCADADRQFRQALRIVLPGTEFFTLYLDRLTPRARAILGQPAAARLARMREAAVLSLDDVDFLLSPDGPERAMLAVRLLDAFRRYTHYRYLNVRELLQAPASAHDALDLVVPAALAFAGRLGHAQTTRGDELPVLAGLVTLFEGLVHPLAAFDQGARADATDSLGLVQNAVEHRGFVGVTLSPAPGSSASDDPALDALLGWCAREEVAVIAPGGGQATPEWWSQLLASYPGLRLGIRTLGGNVLEPRLSGSPLMYGVDWLRRSVEGGPADLLSRRLDEGGSARAVLGDNAAAFLGLRRGGRTRERLERFYDRHRMVAPRWMLALDEARQ